MTTNQKSYWEHVFATKDPSDFSWHEPAPVRSMASIRATGVSVEAPLIDVGAGLSTLVDILSNCGYSDLTVLDIAKSAIRKAQDRLGAKAAAIQWIEEDVKAFDPARRYCLWHDRGLLHFMTDPESISAYLLALTTALVPGGHFVLATFGPEGPDQCSGFEVKRYSVEELTDLLQQTFELREFHLEDHVTPTGTVQQFLYSTWQAIS